MPPAANIPLNVAAVAAAAKQVLAGLGPIAPPQTPLPPVPLAGVQQANPAMQAVQTSKAFDVRLTELSGQAHREISGAVMSGILAAQDVANKVAGSGLGKAQPGGAGGGGKGGMGVGTFITAAASGPIGALGALVPAALGVAAALKAVSLAAPGVVERLNLAFEDTLAVIGQSLAPAFEFLTSIIRTVGDVLATLLPPSSAMREILQPIAETFRELMEALAPIITIIKDVLLVALKALAIAVQVVMIPFKFLAGLIQGLFGSEDDKLKSSTGAAARNISFTSSDSAQKQAYAAIYKNSTGGGMEGMVSGISKTLSDIGENVRAIAQKIGATIKAVGVGLSVANPLAMKDLAMEQFDKMNPGVREAAESKVKPDDMQRMLPGFLEMARKNLIASGVKPEEAEKATNAAREWQQRQIDQAKRRFHDGHPGGH